MASRAGAAPDWRAAFRRSFRRATHMAGAGLLFVLLVFLTLALASYTQTDPSPSTAASDANIGNWMGASGAWASERALNFLGLPAVLLLPLLYIAARRLWSGVERDDEDQTPGRWWRPLAMLLAAIALLGTVLALVFEPGSGSLPAGPGGLFGQLGGLGIEAVAERFGGSFAGWIVLALALAALGGGIALVTRVFALDWAQFLTLPEFVKRKAQLPEFDLPL
ncbi:DNA translocase FtsK 4TM domain-containing protein, partial [Erythrobacter sp. HI0077]